MAVSKVADKSSPAPKSRTSTTSQSAKAAKPAPAKPAAQKAVDPSAGRYAAMDKAVQSSPSAAKNIAAAQKSQAAKAPAKSQTTKNITSPTRLAAQVADQKAAAKRAIINKPVTLKPVTPKTTKSIPSASPITKPTTDITEQPEVSATPQAYGDISTIFADTSTAIKPAPIDTVVFIDETFSNELMTDLLFEDIGGQELLSIARNDTVNGQSVTYQPIKNLNILQEAYNPSNLLKLQETSDKYFANFIIDLRSKIPKIGNGENGLNYYLDLSTGNGIIEFVNLKADEQIEIQIASAAIIEDVGI